MRRCLRSLSFLMLGLLAVHAKAAESFEIKGIYINYSTSVDTDKLKDIVYKAKQVGINTLVMDYVPNSSRYNHNVKWVESQGMRYIPRIIMYPGGGTYEQLTSMHILQDRKSKINKVIALGAKEIQLDYIRFSYKNDSLEENATIVSDVLDKINRDLEHRGVRLQVDVFGITSYGPSYRIGQDIKLMAEHVDSICPMVYPSHYKPYEKHSNDPYGTIRDSLDALVEQLHKHQHVAVYPYIEAYNFRIKMNQEQRVNYIREELRAVNDSHADGWLVWSSNSYYDNLFAALRS